MQNAITRHKISQILQKKRSENQKHYDEEPEIEIRVSYTYEGIQNMYEEGIKNKSCAPQLSPSSLSSLELFIVLEQNDKRKRKRNYCKSKPLVIP